MNGQMTKVKDAEQCKNCKNAYMEKPFVWGCSQILDGDRKITPDFWCPLFCGKSDIFEQKKEEWKKIDNSDDAYISTFGNVFRHGKTINYRSDSEGYIRVSVGGKLHTERIHRLVAKAFIPNPENKPQVNHKDGNKANNHVDNLEWVTREENIEHASRTGLLSKDTGRKGYIIATNVKTGQEYFFENQADMAKRIGAPDGSINKCIKGKRKTVHGYRIEYHERTPI